MIASRRGERTPGSNEYVDGQHPMNANLIPSWQSICRPTHMLQAKQGTHRNPPAAGARNCRLPTRLVLEDEKGGHLL